MPAFWGESVFEGVTIFLNHRVGEDFAGNAIELHDTHGEKLLVLSDRALRALTDEQRARLSRWARMLPLDLRTIELGGGSARCMIVTIHLPAIL